MLEEESQRLIRMTVEVCKLFLAKEIFHYVCDCFDAAGLRDVLTGMSESSIKPLLILEVRNKVVVKALVKNTKLLYDSTYHST